jgi:hypothetical protein
MTDETTTEPEAEREKSPAADLSFIPDDFKGEDGSYDTGAFRARFDELAAAQTITAEGIPEKADDYAFAAPEDLTGLLPEGFDLPEDFALSIADDPDIPELRNLLHEHKAPQALMDGIAKLLAKRELRDLHGAKQSYSEEMQKLGANAQARIDTATRALKSRLPAKEAEAVIADLTTADAVRAVEKLLAASAARPSTSQSAPAVDMATMTPREMIEFGVRQRAAARG